MNFNAVISGKMSKSVLRESNTTLRAYLYEKNISLARPIAERQDGAKSHSREFRTGYPIRINKFINSSRHIGSVSFMWKISPSFQGEI